VRLAGGRELLAWLYRYNRPLPAGALPLPHGDFACFLSESGERAIGEG
jgi:hypothetical protein